MTWQIGRPPREPWRVAGRCAFGYPQVIASPSRLADGTPFPTTFWLTCPFLLREVGVSESEGGAAVWAARLERDAGLAERMLAADAAYREARTAESGGADACAGTGVAGQQRPFGVKCLHAHVAAWLAGIDDPIGEAEMAEVDRECPDARCRSFEGSRP